MKLLIENWRNYLEEDKLEEGLMTHLALALSLMANSPQIEKVQPMVKDKVVKLAGDAGKFKKVFDLAQKAKRKGGIEQEGGYSYKTPNEEKEVRRLLLHIGKLKQTNPELLDSPDVIQALSQVVSKKTASKLDLETPQEFKQ